MAIPKLNQDVIDYFIKNLDRRKVKIIMALIELEGQKEEIITKNLIKQKSKMTEKIVREEIAYLLGALIIDYEIVGNAHNYYFTDSGKKIALVIFKNMNGGKNNG